MSKWIEMEEVESEGFYPMDGEVFIFGDNLSGTIALGIFDEEDQSITLTSNQSIEPDTVITHFIRIPKLPESD